MPIFECGSCDKRIKVPDSYAGKRVRCPGCSSAQRVPDVVNAAALDAFASLDATGAVETRQVREILIGCGPCGKSIRLKEHQLGRTASCPACGTLLSVDAFELPEAKKGGGGLIDMSHLELDAADPLLGGRGFPADAGGSTVGGSSVRMADSHGGGSHSGYALSGHEDPTTLGGGAGDSQTQMRELRELNDLKHSGAVSDAEYRQRKKDIYAGKTLAIQAMSRSIDGSSNPAGRMPTGQDKPLLPGPIKALVAVMVLGVGAYVVWEQVLRPDSGAEAPTPVAVAPVTPVPEVEPEPVPVPAPVAQTPVVEVVETPEAVTPDPADVVPEAPVAAVVEQVPVEAEPEDQEQWLVTEWPVRNGTETVPDQDLPLGRACSYVMTIEARNNGRATVGVCVGPLVESMDDPLYQAFRDKQFDFIVANAEARNMLSALNVDRSKKPVRLGRNAVDRLTLEHKTQRSARAAILTMVQDGRAMGYWFEGQKIAYREFVSAVGKAELMSKTQIAELEAAAAEAEAEAEAAREAARQLVF